MKKSIIALAVAGALTAPMVAQADATLYGSLRLNLANLDGQELDFKDNVSRIGIKGSTELFSGAKGIFQFEQAVNAAEGDFAGKRLASVGITGDFGTVNAGRQWSPFALWTVLPFHVVDNSTAVPTAGYVTGLGYLHRLSNTFAYISPNLGGLQLAAVAIADNNGDGEDLDAYNLAAKYSMGGLMVAASYVKAEAADGDHLSVGATYSMDAVKVGVRYGESDLAGVDTDQYSVFGTYTMGNTKLIANFSDDDNNADDVYSVEVQQKLGKQARVFAAYTDFGTTDGLEVGYRVDF